MRAGTRAAGTDTQDLGNPLRLRRALDHGVRVVVAHCASMGQDRDTDRGANGPATDSFELFARLMDEPRFVGRLYGDISAMTQTARAGAPLAQVIQREDWHARLLNGSDYPLPGVFRCTRWTIWWRGLCRKKRGAIVQAAARAQSAAVRLRAQAQPARGRQAPGRRNIRDARVFPTKRFVEAGANGRGEQAGGRGGYAKLAAANSRLKSCPATPWENCSA